jgi:hypothetical protein
LDRRGTKASALKDLLQQNFEESAHSIQALWPQAIYSRLKARR